MKTVQEKKQAIITRLTVTEEVISMDIKQRLSGLLNGADFKIINGNFSVNEFEETARHNWGQYLRIETMGDQHQERILDLICLVLAEKLHPITIKKYGNTSQASLRRVISERFNTPDMKSAWRLCKQTALAALRNDGLDQQQLTVMSNIIDDLPEMLIHIIVCLAGRLKIIPSQGVSSVSNILIQMMKEGSNVNDTGNN